MLSVVVPLYNKEQSICKTLESVVAQTYTDFEVVIVNDGSTDKSLELVNDFVSRLKIDARRWKIVSKENGGVSSARNRGIVEAQGKYIAFLDGDDIWKPDYLEILAQLIADYPNASLFGLGYGWLKNGNKIPATSQLNYRGIIPNDGSHLMTFWTSCTSSRKEALLNAGLFNEKLTHGEDLDMWWRLMLIGDAVFDSRECAYYVQDSENRAMHHMPSIEKHIVSIIDQYADIRKNNPKFRKAFDTQMVYFLYQYMFTPYKKEAHRLAELLDYSQLKKSLYFRMKYPCLYRMYEQMKKFKNERSSNTHLTH